MKKSRRIYSTLLLLALWVVTAPLHASEWTTQSFAKMRVEHNDNIRFSATDQETSQGVITDLGATFKNDSETLKASITPKLVIRKYNADSDIDSNDQYLNGNVRYLRERSSLGLDASYVRNTTVTSELEDTGVVSVNRRRDSLSLSPSWQYQLSERDAVSLSGSHQDVSYDDGLANGLVDYKNQQVSAAYSRSLTERSKLTASVYQSRYKASNIDSQADTVGGRIGWENHLSERTKASVSAGGYKTEYDYGIVSGDNSGTTLKAGIDHKAERLALGATLTHDVSPSSSGRVRQEDALRLTMKQQIDEKISAGLSATYQHTDSVVRGESNERDYYTIAPSLSWRLTPEWSLGGQYSYRYQKRDSSGSEAEGNAVNISLEYSQLPRQIN